MITLQSTTYVEGITGEEVTDFMMTCTDIDYRRWWSGVHLQFHTVRAVPGGVGSVVYMDEYIGARRVRMYAIVEQYTPGRTLVWQMKEVMRLPVWVSLDSAEDEKGVQITHTITAGLRGLGSILNPLLRAFFSPRFAAAMDAHVKTEFRLLRDLIKGRVGCDQTETSEVTNPPEHEST